MNFNALIGLAQKANHEKNKQPIKGFSTATTPAKKPVRSNVPSASVQAFLAKKEQEQRDKVKQFQKEKENLLALRAQNSKSNKAAKLMASRTKDNDFSRIRLTEDEIEAREKVEAQLRRQVICDKVERMKARIKLDDIEAAQPHKRKRKPKTHPHDDMELSPTLPPAPPSPPPPEQRPNGPKKHRPPAAPPMSFEALISLASVKQFEDPEDNDDMNSKSEGPMTVARKLEEEYKKYKMRGGTAGRTAFEIEFFKNEDNRKRGRGLGKKIPKKQVVSRDQPPQSPPAKKPTSDRSSYDDSRVVQRPTDKGFQRPVENRIPSKNTDGRNVQRTVENKSGQRISENKTAQRTFENKGSVRTSDGSASRQSSDGNTARRTSDGNVARQNSDSNVVRRTSDGSSVRRTSESNSASRDGKNSREGKSVHTSSQKLSSANSQRTSDNSSSRRPEEVRKPQRDENTNSQRMSNGAQSQRSASSGNVPHQRSNNDRQRNSDDRPRNSDNRQRNIDDRQRNSDNRQRNSDDRQRNSDDRRTSDVKHKNQDRGYQDATPKVPSYSTVKPGSAKPSSSSKNPSNAHRTNSSHNEPQFKSPPARQESAFLNSLPTKKPKLNYPQKTPPSVSKQEPTRERQSTNFATTTPKSSSSKVRPESDNRRNGQLDSSNARRQESSNYPNRPMNQSKTVSNPIKSLSDRRPVKQTAYSFNDNWLEDDGGAPQDNIVPKKKVPAPSVPSDKSTSSVPQKRPPPDGERRKSQNPVKNVQQKSNPNGTYSDRKPLQKDNRFEQNVDRDRQQPPEKKMKLSQDNNFKQRDRREDDFRRPSDRPPVKKRPLERSEYDMEREEPSGPKGSRRPLDSPWGSMARNPYKLPPIRNSKCSYIKSDSEEDEEDEEEEEFDDDMADFIDDEPVDDEEDYSRHIRDIFGYDKRRYRNEIYKEEAMESSYSQQMKEEARSRRIGRLEDMEEERKEMERKKKPPVKKSR